MQLAPLSFALVLLTQSPRSDPSPAELEALVRGALAAVETGRDSAERATWNARLEADGVRARLVRATIDRLTYRYEDAERGYRALADDGRAGAIVRAYALLGLAQAHLQRGRLKDADPLLRQALPAMSVDRDAAAGRVVTLVHLGLVVERLVGVDSALATYSRAESLVPRGDAWLRALVRCNTLVTRVRSADRQAATSARAESRAARDAGNTRAAGACLAALAQDQERRGQRDSAMATFTEAGALHRRSRNYTSLAITRQWQGYVLRARGDVVAARPALREAVALGRLTGTLAAAGWAELTLADIALQFGDIRSAGRSARSAAATFAISGDRSGMVIARQLEGDAALLRGATRAARDAYEEVLRDAPALFPTIAPHARSRLAAVARFEGDWDAAERELDLALAEAARLDITNWQHAEVYDRAMLALSRGQLDEAGRRLIAMDSALTPVDGAARSDVLTRLAEVHIRAGRPAEGEAALRRAGDLLDALRAVLRDRDLQASVVEARYLDWDRDVGFATAIAGLTAAGRAPAAFALAEQRRARLLLEGIVRRQALAGHSGPPEHTTGAIDDAIVRRILPDSTAVLSYVTGSGHEPTTVFILTRDSLAAVVAAPVDDHVDGLRRFAGLLAAGVHPAILARQLGDAFLVEPLRLLPPGIRRLIIVPDGPLHRAPFDAMMLSADSMLMDRFIVTLAPSAAVAVHWWREKPRQPRPRLLAFGDPTGVRIGPLDGDSVPPRLPVAAREVRRIARYARQAVVFVGPEAQESHLDSATLADVGIVHFATHADVEDWSLMEGALLLAPGGSEDGRLTSEEVLDLPIQANLVILSACRSGSGAVRAGEGLSGLTIPLLEAGAASVAATLWPVGDRAVAPMMDLLYDELASGVPVGDAMHAARHTARARGLSPAVWAAFSLTGDPRVGTPLRRPPLGPFAMIPLALAVLGVAYYGIRTTRRRNIEGR